MAKYSILFIPFKQNNQDYLIGVMPFACIDAFSHVLIYGKDTDGYQRKPEPKHYNKIRDYLLSVEDAILPTSITLGLDDDVYKKLSRKQGEYDVLVLDSAKTTKPIFRIVDGQHRIFGLRLASETKPEIQNFLLPIIVVLTPKKRQSIELEIFNDINSKSKRVKVDLIQLARYDYRLKEETINSKNINEHICIKTAFILKEPTDQEADNKSVWLNAIKFDIHNELVLGVVGVNSFMESIEPIVRVSIRDYTIDAKNGHRVLLKYVDSTAEKISNLLFSCWDKIIKQKWSEAFDKKQVAVDIDGDIKAFYYKKEYYIQRTIGVKALNGIIGDLYKESNGSSANTMKAFSMLIERSSVKNSDWQVGGSFAGFSSESGVKQIKQKIAPLKYLSK